MVDDTERRLNVLFDALNCDMVEPKALQQLQQLVHGEFPSVPRTHHEHPFSNGSLTL